ncbi:S8 family peptidase [Marinithermofilum abyssi]|nr:S8 family peptidase [Marinithermofilum abyssi]
MMHPRWFPEEFPSFGRKSRFRKIFHLRDYRSPHECIREMQRVGGRPLRVLPHLGMVIGEFYQEYGAQSFHGHPDIAFWEPDIKVTITDPFLGAIADRTASLPWGIQRVEAPKAWNYTQGRGIKVAVIDTGIANDHPALKGNYKGGVNILSQMFTPYDYNGHGTHVAGTIAGRANDMGLVGVAPRVHLYAVKAFNRKGSANLSDLLSAINWCIENKMDVINMSFGMAKVSDTLRQAIVTAYRKGIVMIAAAGNQGTNNVEFPARFKETIGVTSISKDGKLSSFSNVGPGVDIAAPGDKITSSWLNGTTREMSGTSMAVPHVVGTVALLLYLRPDLTPVHVRQILTYSSVGVAGETKVRSIHAYRSVQTLARLMGRLIP